MLCVRCGTTKWFVFDFPGGFGTLLRRIRLPEHRFQRHPCLLVFGEFQLLPSFGFVLSWFGERLEGHSMHVLVLDFEFCTFGISLRRLHRVDKLRDSFGVGV